MSPRPRRRRNRPSAVLMIGLVGFAVLAAGVVVVILNRGDEWTVRDPYAWDRGDPVHHDGLPNGLPLDEEPLEPPPPEEPGAGEAVVVERPPENRPPENRPPPEDEPASVKAPIRPDEPAAEVLARREADAAALARWPELDLLVGEDARNLRFDLALDRIDAFVGLLQTIEARATPQARLDDIIRQKGLFARTVAALEGKIGARVEVRSGLVLTLTAVDVSRIQGKRGPATMTLRWTDLSGEELHAISVGQSDGAAERQIDLAVLCYEHGLTEEAEEHLLDAHEDDASVKPTLDALLARRRGEAVPDDGYVVHENRWVTVKEKTLLENGFRKWNGEWLPEDEYMTARGFVRHEDRWITREELAEIEEQRREHEALIAKLLPQGLIDQPGHGQAVDWSDAIVIKTKNYRIRTNLSREVANDIAFTMETLHMSFRRILGLRRKSMPTFEIQVCRDLNEYRTVLRGIGLGQAGGGVIKTFYQPPRTTAVLMHEGTHQFVYKLAPTCPRWLHEGMATYFECSQFRLDEKTRKPTLDVGLLNRNRLMGIQAAIRSDRQAPMEEFISGKKGNPYTQGWSVVYYLAKAHDGKYARRLLPFVEDAGKGKTIKRFLQAFRFRKLEEFETDWRAFVMGLDPAKGIDVFVPENRDGVPPPPDRR